MNIITLTPETIAHGEEAFQDCIRQYLGSSDTARHVGAEVIPGAISATIRSGITDEVEICRIVSRISRCRVTKVRQILHGLADDSVAGRLWACDALGTFYPKGRTTLAPAAVMID